MRGTSGAPSFAARAYAWGGAVLFAASLSYFLYSYVVTFGVTQARGSISAPVATNVTLFTAFALHHSVFARLRVRALVTRVIPPPLERSSYVWLSSLLFILVCAAWQPVPGTAWTVTGPSQWLFFTLQLAGAWLTLKSAAAIDVLELAGIRQLSSTASAAVFTSSGPYGWVRHPIYTGWFLMVFCAPRMTMTRFVFASVSSAYLLMAIPFEERSLLASSGGLYQQYIERVRWKLIPRVY